MLLLQKSSQTVAGHPTLPSHLAPHCPDEHENEQDPLSTHLS